MSEPVVIVTGGASYIGAATAELLLEAGRRVVLADVDVAHGEEHAEALGARCEFVATDLRDDADLDRLVGIAAAAGRISGLVNNAAVFTDHGVHTDRATWVEALEVNVVASAVLVDKALPHLEASRGAVVNVASISGRVSQPGRVVYNTTKAAILQMTRTMAQALAPRGVRVNSVSPGWTWSRNIERRWGSRERADSFAAEFQPLGRMADPREVGYAIRFLMSDEAAFITGADLRVDGGYGALGPEALGQAAAKVPPVEGAGS